MSLLGIDVGTMGCKAVVFNRDGDILASQYKEHPLLHPNPGWTEALAISCQGEAVITAVKQQDEFVPDKNILKSYEQRYKIYKKIYSANKSILREISVLN